ncbi:MAG: cytochrome c oxidase subunit 3 [Pacificimonas sp.]|nr:cytochrome c oxidase subunit 3 [Pacificimonas sp.]
MAGAKNHDFHILEPSWWPLLASIGALVMFSGAVMWMHEIAFGAITFWLGLAAVSAIAFFWWSDVAKEANQGDHTPVVQLHHRYGMILFIASEVMFFVAWFWAYFDASLYPDTGAAVGGVWPPEGIEVLSPWTYPLLNTLILLLSGTTVTWAHHALIEGDREGLKKGLWATVILGVIFSAIQAYEYGQAAFGFSGNIYGATFYMATGFHGFHVIVGTIFLIVCLVRAYAGAFTPKQHFGFEAAAWYWHFVDVVWLFLFIAIYVWGSDFGAAVAAY